MSRPATPEEEEEDEDVAAVEANASAAASSACFREPHAAGDGCGKASNGMSGMLMDPGRNRGLGGWGDDTSATLPPGPDGALQNA